MYYNYNDWKNAPKDGTTLRATYCFRASNFTSASLTWNLMKASVRAAGWRLGRNPGWALVRDYEEKSTNPTFSHQRLLNVGYENGAVLSQKKAVVRAFSCWGSSAYALWHSDQQHNFMKNLSWGGGISSSWRD